MTMKRLVLYFFVMSMLSRPLLFAIDNLKLNSKLDYTSDSLDGPLITGDDAQSGFVAGNPNNTSDASKARLTTEITRRQELSQASPITSSSTAKDVSTQRDKRGAPLI